MHHCIIEYTVTVFAWAEVFQGRVEQVLEIAEMKQSLADCIHIIMSLRYDKKKFLFGFVSFSTKFVEESIALNCKHLL